MLLVVDHFGPLDLEHENAVYYTTLATFMARQGFRVTVLQLEPPGPQWETLVALYKGKGVALTQLPRQRHPLKFGGSHEAEQAYRVYRYLVDLDTGFETVYFLSRQAAGFYALQSQRQGVVCFGSRFVVAIDGLTEVRKHQIRRGQKGVGLVHEASPIRQEWMMQRSVELADVVIASNKALLDAALDQGWRVPDNVYLLPYLTVPVANDKAEFERADELIPSRQAMVREFVYVGPLGTASGLVLFLNAVDNVLSRDAKAHRKYLKGRPLKVTFYGPNDLVNDEGDLSGEHYIEMRAFSWGSRVKWAVKSQEMNLKRLIRYLTEAGKGRVAVVPSLLDSAGFFVHQALRAGVPVMSSSLRCIQELVHVQDRRDILFAANDTVALARKMLDSWNNGGMREPGECVHTNVSA